jgi:hypothetical protein
VRRILGVLSLARQHGSEAINDACRAANEFSVCLPTASFSVTWSGARRRSNAAAEP